MEFLLSMAFDNLSSYDSDKIGKGLRQVDGVLAQICLCSPAADDGTRPGSAGSQASSSTTSTSASSSPGTKSLTELSGDPAFREFFKLQEGFQWNVAMRLITTLDRLMGRGYSDGQNDLLILSSLDRIQGVLLLHPPSKALFCREQNMNVKRNSFLYSSAQLAS
jgi:hypothetical protein